MDLEEYLKRAEGIAKDMSDYSGASFYKTLYYVLHCPDMFTELQGYNKILKIRK